MPNYPDPMEGRCTARVWSNGDMDPCGDKAVVADRCLHHRDREVSGLQETIQELQGKIAKAEARIAVLMADAVQDTVDRASSRI